MKKLIYLFLTVLIVACSSDDSSNNNVTNSLEGRWDYTSSYDDGLGGDCDWYFSLENNGIGVEYDYEDYDPNTQETVECYLFSAAEVTYTNIENNTYIFNLIYSDGYVYTLNATLNNNTLTFIEPEYPDEYIIFTRE